MDRDIVAHTLVAAHASRVSHLASLYDALERAVRVSGVDSDAARHAYGHLSERIVEWEMADLEAERRDVVTLAADERAALEQDLARAIVFAEQHARGLPPTAREHTVVRSLRQIQAAFPKALPRAALVRFRRSAARLKRLEELKGPAFVLGSEAGVLLGALESATTPLVRPDVEFDAADGFQNIFAWGLERCTLREPGASGAVDLGLGTSPAVPALLGVFGQDPKQLYEEWNRTAAPSHPFTRFPYVPQGRFCTASPTRLVRADLDSTGPIAWCAGDDVAGIARELLAVAEKEASAAELVTVSNRVAAAARRGEALIGFIEYVPGEAEGERKWLIDPAGDGGR
jgi:hypothetical protein